MLIGDWLAAAPPVATHFHPAGVQQGQTVEVTVGGTFERWPIQVWCDRKAVTVTALKDKGKLSITAAQDAEPSQCLIRLYDEQGATAARPFLIGTLPEILEQEPNDDVRKPQVLGSTTLLINGRLEKANDVDCFAVKLSKGQTLVASLEANQRLGSPIDAILQVVSSDGFVLEENHDTHGLDPQVVFEAPKDGTFIVRTFAFPSTPDSGIRFTGSDASVYRLTLTTAGFADHAFPLAVSRSKLEAVTLHGWNLSNANNKLTPDRDSPDVALLWHPRLGNTTTLRVEPHATTIRADENDRTHPQRLELPTTVSGRMRPKASDFYQFEAKKGEKLLFHLESRSLGQPLDAVLRVLDAAGKSLAQADDPSPVKEGARDPELTFTVPETGRYLLEVRDLHGRGGFRFVYRLRAIAAVPDFTVSLATDQFVLTPGKPLDIPVAITRRHGFDKEIEISAGNLPEGLKAEPVKSMPSGATASAVTLKLIADAGPLSASLQVHGKASSVGLKANSPDFWVTVLKP
jgi:hypothetical protein